MTHMLPFLHPMLITDIGLMSMHADMPYPVLIIGICLSWFSVLMKLNDITESFSM